MQTTTVWTCDACLDYLYIQWALDNPGAENHHRYSTPNIINPKYYEFNDEFAPEGVKSDVAEALKCLSLNCFNAFAAMCRRAIQTICDDANVSGGSRVEKQLEEFKEASGINEGSDDAHTLDSIIKTGHDGAHPHLPRVNEKRAKMLLILLQDIIDQIYNRPGRIAEAQKLRDVSIEEKKATSE